MEADFSVELGHDDPVLDFPWSDPEGKLGYVDLKKHPEQITRIEEAQGYTELADFLRRANSSRSAVESAKCDVWTTTELDLEEEVFAASQKMGSYVDVIFSDASRRFSFPVHEDFAKKLTELLRRAPEIRASAEVCVRRCFFVEPKGTRDGFYFTLYISGFGNDEASARRNWGVGLSLVGNAILQLSSRAAS